MSEPKTEDTDTSTWPHGLVQLARIIGTELTLRLANIYGGVAGFYIPRVARPSHAWAELLGIEAWQRLCVAFGGQRIDVPSGAFRDLKKRVILDLRGQGLSYREIALRARASQRYVQDVLLAVGEGGSVGRRGRPVDPRQTKLFD